MLAYGVLHRLTNIFCIFSPEYISVLPGFQHTSSVPCFEGQIFVKDFINFTYLIATSWLIAVEL